MDTGEMQQLLVGYLNEMDWRNGATKDDILEHLAERDDDLLTLVNEYVAEGTYKDPGAVMNVIPVQAWQASQGDTWRGGEVQYTEDVPSNFEAGPVGEDERDVYHEGGPRPQTPGFGESAGAQQSASSNSTRSAASSQTRAAANTQQSAHAGMPGDGAGRREDPGTRDAGVWPVSGKERPDDPNIRMQGMASFGQGERGAAGYEDSGRSEAETVPVDDTVVSEEPPSMGTAHYQAGNFGAPGSNAGEVDPAISGSAETTGEKPRDTGGAGFGNAVGGGAEGDTADTGDNTNG